MKQFWDERYNGIDYVYGVEPNEFFSHELKKLPPGSILLPAEGEGRNALFAAKLGWDVLAYDFSKQGREKALQLCSNQNLTIEYQISTFQNFSAKENSFDCVALIYAHMPTDFRSAIHQQLISFLKPGGTLILEAFSKEQLGNSTGGPQKLDLLYSQKDLRNDFSELSAIHITQEQIQLSEGELHKGEADVIRLVGIK